MSDPTLNLPQELNYLDERLLPQECRDQIANMVRLGHRREHMVISRYFEVHINPELMMLYPINRDDDESDV